VKRSSLQRLTLAALVALGAAACSTPFPGYRHEDMGPDQRLLALVDQIEQQKANGGVPPETNGVVDGGRVYNELRRLSLDYPAHAPTLYVLASETYEMGRRERAGAYLDDIFDVQPRHPEAGVLRARIAIHEGNLSAARRVLEQQIRYTPDHSGLREALGSVLYMSGDLEDARAELERARRLGAPAWRVAFNLGLIEEAAGNHTLAMERYQVSLRLNEEFAPAASRLAGLEAQFGEVER